MIYYSYTTAKGGKDNTHILNRGIGEDSFHILFHRSVEHAEERREQSHEHDDKAIGKNLHAEEIKDKTAKAINGYFEHNTTHER